MNDLQTRINAITQILASEPSKANKVIASLQAFSGMDITHFNSQQKKSVYRYMATINDVTSRYSPSIKTNDDYKIMSDADLNIVLKNVQQLCIKLLID